MSQNLGSAVAVIGIDIGKNSFHVVELDRRGVIVLRCTEVSQQSVVMGHSRPMCLVPASHYVWNGPEADVLGARLIIKERVA
jgi:hypothetical protein